MSVLGVTITVLVEKMIAILPLRNSTVVLEKIWKGWLGMNVWTQNALDIEAINLTANKLKFFFIQWKLFLFVLSNVVWVIFGWFELKI